MPATKTVITLDKLTRYDGKIKDYIDNADAEALKTITYNSSTRVISFYCDAEPLANDATAAYTVTLPADIDLSGVEGDIDALETLIGTIPTHVDDVSGETVPDAADIVTYIGQKFAAASSAATTASAVTMVASSAQDTPAGMYKTYTFYQGGNTSNDVIGTVNVPVDLVVESGQIVSPTVSDPITINDASVTSGTYIELTIANQTDPIYINVADLVDVYTVADNATQVQLAVSAGNELSATLVDGGVSKAKLATALQNSIDAIDDITYATDAQIDALFSSGSGTGE